MATATSTTEHATASEIAEMLFAACISGAITTTAEAIEALDELIRHEQVRSIERGKRLSARATGRIRSAVRSEFNSILGRSEAHRRNAVERGHAALRRHGVWGLLPE